MGGKLEHKVEVIVVEAEIPRPTWMSGNMKKMTKDQIKEIKEFDAKVKVRITSWYPKHLAFCATPRSLR